jgi:hypothetical protein
MYKKALVKESSNLFPKFSQFNNFYLVGGTALALQIGHRVSVDFDFFSGEEIPINLLQKIKRTFPNSSVEVSYKEVKQQITLLLGGVKTTFFYYPYPVIDDFVKYQEVSMATIREIAAMKAFSIGKRLSYKDYIDWYFLLKEKHTNLEEVITLAKKKFNGDFNSRLFLGQLVSLEDVSTQEISFIKSKVKRSDIKKFLEKEVKSLNI